MEYLNSRLYGSIFYFGSQLSSTFLPRNHLQMRCSLPSRSHSCSAQLPGVVETNPSSLGKRLAPQWHAQFPPAWGCGPGLTAWHRIARTVAGWLYSYRGKKMVLPPVLGKISNLPHNETKDEKSENDVIQTFQIRILPWSLTQPAMASDWEYIWLTPAYLVLHAALLVCLCSRSLNVLQQFLLSFTLCNRVIQPSFYSLP